MITLYGIPNCDKIRRARKWLSDHNIDYRFHDFRKDGLNEKQLKQWIKQIGWEILLNKRGMTWRKLDDETKNNIDEKSAMKIMLDNPAIIKRPVLEAGKILEVGFDEDRYRELLG
ncbi:MAG TPA: ArsC family reductase [Chromatiales bacterium]|nr:ArsC family reductase [Thiotrichales bacterium]HIP67339.1 ArsC family reductase [Chromatiales bacterium]